MSYWPPPQWQMRAAILQHHGPCLGFALEEPCHVNVWRNRVEEAGLPLGAWLKPLKAAVRGGLPDETPIGLPDGQTAPLGTLRQLVSVERGQKIGYVTDVADAPQTARRSFAYAIRRICCSSKQASQPRTPNAPRRALTSRRRRLVRSGAHAPPVASSHSTSRLAMMVGRRICSQRSWLPFPAETHQPTPNCLPKRRSSQTQYRQLACANEKRASATFFEILDASAD